jgi:hypothetical protein
MVLPIPQGLGPEWFAEVTGENIDTARQWLDGVVAPKRKHLTLIRREALASFGSC